MCAVDKCQHTCVDVVYKCSSFLYLCVLAHTCTIQCELGWGMYAYGGPQ